MKQPKPLGVLKVAAILGVTRSRVYQLSKQLGVGERIRVAEWTVLQFSAADVDTMRHRVTSATYRARRSAAGKRGAIIAARAAHPDWTQAQIAAECGVSVSWVSKVTKPKEKREPK